MSLLFVTDFLPPAFSATGQYTYSFAKKYANKKIKTILVGLGQEKKVFYDNEYLKIYKLKIFKLNKESQLNRIFWNINSCYKICKIIVSERANFAYLIFNGTPQFLIYFIFFLNFFIRKKIIFRTTDYFPETLIQSLNNKFLKKIVKFFLLKFTFYIRSKFYKLQFLGFDQKNYTLKNISVKKNQIKRDYCLIKIPSKKIKRKKYKIILYSGNLGLAHDYKTFAKSYINYVNKNKNTYKLWINASGKELSNFLKILDENKIKYYLTKIVPIHKLGKLLSMADIHLVFLKKNFNSIVLPSKIFCILKTQGDIIYIGPSESDIKLLIEKKGGYTIENDNYQKLSGILEKLKSSF